MRNLKIFILVILAVLLIGGVLISCGGNDGNSGDNITTETPAQNQTNNEENQNDTANNISVMPEFPHEIKTFGGSAFTILVEDEPSNYLEITDYDIEEVPGDVLNSAIYTRNMKVEELLDIKIKGIHTENVRSLVTKAVKSGIDDYDAVAPRLWHAAPMAMAGECVNLNGLEYLSLDMPWWDKNILKDLSIGGQSYLIAGDIFTKHYEAIGMLFFNKKLLENYGLNSPYRLVEQNEWTIDNFSGLTKNITQDINGDGVITHEDQFGLATQADFLTSMINGCGAKYIEKDSNDMPVYTGGSEKISSIIEKVFDFYINDTFCLHRDALAKNIPFDRMHQFMVFPYGRSLFLWGLPRFIDLELRTMDDDFGMLPIPKYDSGQDRYYATANAWHSYTYIIPQSSGDPDNTAYIMDTMAYYGRIHILPAYYEVCLQRKYTRDEESSAMLDIIFNSAVYDMGDIYNIGGYRSALEGMIQKNVNNMMSEYEKALGKIEKDLAKLISQFEENAK